jgi:transposase InsO family protein
MSPAPSRSTARDRSQSGLELGHHLVTDDRAGVYLRLYLIMDVWSRRIVGWRIAEADSAESAAELITQSCRGGKLDPTGLVLHSDNGNPMRASTLSATLQWLEVNGPDRR